MRDNKFFQQQDSFSKVWSRPAREECIPQNTPTLTLPSDESIPNRDDRKKNGSRRKITPEFFESLKS